MICDAFVHPREHRAVAAVKKIVDYKLLRARSGIKPSNTQHVHMARDDGLNLRGAADCAGAHLQLDVLVLAAVLRPDMVNLELERPVARCQHVHCIIQRIKQA